EKIMGFTEGALTLWLAHLLQSFLVRNDLGILAGADGTVCLMPDLVRIPDISFVSWEKLPNRQLPPEPIPDLVPDLAVEVLSKGNTRGEMALKLKDYFLAGVRLVWFVDPRKRTVRVFTGPDRSTVLTEQDTLDGADVLPGLALLVKQVFARLPSAGNPNKTTPPPGKKRRRKGDAS